LNLWSKNDQRIIFGVSLKKNKKKKLEKENGLRRMFVSVLWNDQLRIFGISLEKMEFKEMGGARVEICNALNGWLLRRL